MFPVNPGDVTKEKSWAYWDGAFSYEELQMIIDYGKKIPPVEAQVGDGTSQGNQLKQTRNSIISWIEPKEEINWLYQRIANTAKKINDDYFGFHLWGLCDALQFTVYNGSEQKEEQGHYDWHIDCNGTGRPARKLSMILQLSDPMDYEGGELWMNGYRRACMDKIRGRMYFFPSYTLHRVTPVTQGTRISLVAWISGPDFV